MSAPASLSTKPAAIKCTNSTCMYTFVVNDAAPEFLNVRETARRLAVHENTVRSYAKQGLLPDSRVPETSFYRFRASDVERLKAQRGAPAVSLAAERRTASPEYATASQLALWPQTNAREAQHRLPELVRRLLFETPGAGQISIRTGDGVALAGKDGVATLGGADTLAAGRTTMVRVRHRQGLQAQSHQGLRRTKGRGIARCHLRLRDRSSMAGQGLVGRRATGREALQGCPRPRCG
ncbi:helix-turn-helix domain-containing protein [Luteococcus sediminum]